MMLKTITTMPIAAMMRKMPMTTNHRTTPTTYGDRHRDLEVQRGRGVLAHERAPVLQDQVADQGRDEAEEDAADVDERRPELLVGRAELLARLVVGVAGGGGGGVAPDMDVSLVGSP